MIESSVQRRVERGLGLVDRVSQHGDLFVVLGGSRNYTVCLDHQTYGETCSCPDMRLQLKRQSGIQCKHIIATTIYNARITANGDNCRRGAKIIRH